MKVDKKEKKVSYYFHLDKNMKSNSKKAIEEINKNNKIISKMISYLNNDLSSINNEIKDFIIKNIDKIKKENDENNNFLESLRKNK